MYFPAASHCAAEYLALNSMAVSFPTCSVAMHNFACSLTHVCSSIPRAHVGVERVRQITEQHLLYVYNILCGAMKVPQRLLLAVVLSLEWQ